MECPSILERLALNQAVDRRGIFRYTPKPLFKGAYMASKKPTNETTSARVASTAGKLLVNPNTPKAVRQVAASALTQRPNKKK
jgi:hypothetical protein